MASFHFIASVQVEFSRTEIALLNRLMRIATTDTDEPVQLDQRFSEEDLKDLDTLYNQLPDDNEF